MLVGRKAELARIEDAVAGARRGEGAALALIGEPGIGKSSLLREARRRASVAGLKVLAAHGVEAESDLAFGGLLELVGPATGTLDALPEGQRQALEIALGRRDGEVPDRFAVGAALLGLLSSLAGEDGLLVTVDDAQWLDGSSLDAIRFAGHRLAGEGMALLIASRTVDGDRSPIEQIELGGLGPDEAGQLLGDSAPTLAAGPRDELISGAGGNPLALIEAPRALTPEQMAGRTPLPAAIKPGAAIEAAFRGRLAALDPGVQRLLVLAAAAEDIELQSLTGAAGELGLDPAGLVDAERAEILDSEGGRVRFLHPLLRIVAYHSGTAFERRSAHAAIARALPADDLGRRAWHRSEASIGPDEDVARELLAAAEVAAGRGARLSSGELGARAAAATADPALRASRAALAADDLIRGGRPDRAGELAESFDGPEVPAGVAAALKRTRALVAQRAGDIAAGHALLLEVAGALEVEQPAIAAKALLEATIGTRVMARYAELNEIATRAERLALAADPVDGESAALALAARGIHLATAGDPTAAEVIEGCEHALLNPSDTVATELTTGPVHAAVWLERYGWADRVLERMTESARRRGSPSEIVYPLGISARIALRRGDLGLARAHADEAARLADETNQFVLRVHSLTTLAEIEATAGDSGSCLGRVEQIRGLMEGLPHGAERLTLKAVGELALTLGDPEGAIGPLEVCDASDRATGNREPRVFTILANLLEVQLWLGRESEARESLERLEFAAKEIGGSWHLGAAARGRGLLCPDEEIDAHFEASAAAFEAGEARLERARSELLWGERLRRARRRNDARVPLRRALERFELSGAGALAERARKELAATGEEMKSRPPEARDELTPQELRIALRVGEGRTNPEVASELFISRKTVEHHLSRIYRKLGVRSRTELSHALAPLMPEHPASAEVSAR